MIRRKQGAFMEHLRRFEDRVVLITGASRGIGRGIALRFAREGANLVLNGTKETVNDVAEDVRRLGCRALPLIADVAVKSQVEEMYRRAVQEFGPLHVSIHNAGIMTIARLHELTEQEWDRVLAVNTKGVFLCCQAAARYMMKQGYGKIINNASGQAREGGIYSPHYAASKFGVIGMTQSLAKELAPYGITVNAFCPGIIETDMWRYADRIWGKLLGDYPPGELMKEWAEGSPIKRAGTPEDVAGLVAFLASDDANYITGQTINVDGGMIMS
jgi:meso-butanediol dehydrogenase/(S,S)-butanediol dehydrogenase/diacetyl reductase